MDPFDRRRQARILQFRRQTGQESLMCRSVAVGQAWWGHAIRHVGSCPAAIPLLWRHEIWRTVVNVAEVALSPGWRHPGIEWRRPPDSWLFAFSDSAFLTAPLDRGAWAASRQSYIGWVVDAVRGPAIMGQPTAEPAPYRMS